MTIPHQGIGAQAAAQKFNTELEEINDGVEYEDAMDDVVGSFSS